MMKLSIFSTCLLFGFTSLVAPRVEKVKKVTPRSTSDVTPLEITSERKKLELIVQKIQIDNSESIRNLNAFNNKVAYE